MNRAELIRKLRLDKAGRMLVIDAPTVYLEAISSFHFDREPDPKFFGSYDFVQIFATNQAALEEMMNKWGQAGKKDCFFWICYPKLSGKIRSEIKRETSWKAFEIAGLRPVSQVSLDETWSALRGRPKELVGK